MSVRHAPIALSDLMARISVHLDDLADDVARIEEAIGAGVLDAPEEAAEVINRFQRLDYLRQTLEDLALLSHFIGKSCSGPAPADAAHRLKLAATRALLVPGGPFDTRDQSEGEVDFF